MSAPTTNPTGAQTGLDDQSGGGAGGLHSHDAHRLAEDHLDRGVVGPTPTELPIHRPTTNVVAAARSAPTSATEPIPEPDATRVAARWQNTQTPSAAPRETPSATGPVASLADPFLALAADVLDDLERVWIANGNRLRQLTRSTADVDGEERGFGLDESHPDVARLAALVDSLDKAQHQATLNLQRQMRGHPLAGWAASHRGVGEKQVARLLAAIGDPAWNDATGAPRTLRQLWSYCGYGDAATQVRRKGQRANWNDDAKKRAHLVAVSLVKGNRGEFREVYDKSRARYDGAVHAASCARCGPSGHPAAAGSPLSAAHQNARALRLVSKELLRSLWREARRLHGFDGQEAM